MQTCLPRDSEVSHNVKSQWDGAVLGEPAPRSSKTPSGADLTREEAASLLRSLRECSGLEDRQRENWPARLKCPGGMMFIGAVPGGLAGWMSLTEKPREL